MKRTSISGLGFDDLLMLDSALTIALEDGSLFNAAEGQEEEKALHDRAERLRGLLNRAFGRVNT